MVSVETLITISILVALFTVILLVLFILMKINKQQRYDKELNKVMIDEMRNSFEKGIYELTDRLMATQERWIDANHLLISSQKNNEIDLKKEKQVSLTDFLKSNGITEKDLEIDNKLVFVLTPFNKNFDAEFETLRKICNRVDLKCLRGDEQFIKGDIFQHILKNLIRASIIIANIDGRNPNVFYELGLSHALNKNTILVAKTNSKLPVDIKSKYMILYKNYTELENELKNQLLKIFSNI